MGKNERQAYLKAIPLWRQPGRQIRLVVNNDGHSYHLDREPCQLEQR